MNKTAHPGLYEAGNETPVLIGSRCSTCHHVFFPPLAIGCEACGAAESSLERVELAARGTLHSMAVVHLHQGSGIDAPFAIGEIQLDGGPLIRATLAEVVDVGAIGTRMEARWFVNETTPDGDEVVEPRFVAATGTADNANPDDSLATLRAMPDGDFAPSASDRAARPLPRRLRELRPVRVVGVGLHPYQRAGDTPYTALGVHAVRAALADAGLAWSDVEAAFTGTATTAMGMSRLMYRHLGSTGIAMTQVENASASGSSAFRLACMEVASGLVDVAIAVGVDKPLRFVMPQGAAGLHDLVGNRVMPFTHFALLANRYIHQHGATPRQFGLVAVKNSRHGALNPNAQRQKARTLEEVMAPPLISGPLTRLQCCPIGEGAAAAIVASEDAIARLGLDRARAVRVAASASRSETVYRGENFDAALTRETTAIALRDAGIAAGDLDVVELHDAFTVEELLYVEAMGLCPPGHAAAQLEEGQFDLGGRVAISPSGGLLSMGHPIGPTGVGQVCEITTQLRGEAGARQHRGARKGLAHMVGVGAVCVVSVLTAD